MTILSEREILFGEFKPPEPFIVKNSDWNPKCCSIGYTIALFWIEAVLNTLAMNIIQFYS